MLSYEVLASIKDHVFLGIVHYRDKYSTFPMSLTYYTNCYTGCLDDALSHIVEYRATASRRRDIQRAGRNMLQEPPLLSIQISGVHLDFPNFGRIEWEVAGPGILQGEGIFFA